MEGVGWWPVAHEVLRSASYQSKSNYDQSGVIEMYDANSEEDLLWELRCAVGRRILTLEDLARRLGHSSHTNLSAIFSRRARLSVPMLFRIAEALDMKVSFSLTLLEDTPGAVLKYPQRQARPVHPFTPREPSA